MLLLLKDYLKAAYTINAERIAAFGPSGGRCRALAWCSGLKSFRGRMEGVGRGQLR